MHDEKRLDALADRVRQASPAEPTHGSLDRVRDLAGSRTSRPHSGPRVWRTVAAAAAAVVLAVSLAVAVDDAGTAFAKVEALAALYPPNGSIVHLRTTGHIYNEGEPAPTEEQREIEDSWIDYAGGRARTAWLSAATGEKNGEVLTADGTWWRVGDDYETPEPDRILQVSPATIRPGGLDAFEYLKEALADGDVVGEIERDGDIYWDIRWSDETDRYGLKFSARALLRKSDYRPALIEHSYPGGAQTRWEVLEWSVVPTSSIATDTFDPASLAEPGLPEIHVWPESTLSEETSRPVYSAGPAVGPHRMLEHEAGESSFLRYVRFGKPVDAVLGGDRIAADYMEKDSGKVMVSVSTAGGPISPGALKDSLAELDPAKTAKVTCELGTATLVTLRDGSSLAVLPLADTALAVQADDEDLVLEALKTLMRVR